MRSTDLDRGTEVEDVELRLEPCTENQYYDRLPDIEKQYVSQAICVVDEDLSKTNLHGSPDSIKSSVLEVRVKKCHGKTNCKSEEEIDEYLARHAFIIHSA